MNGTAAGPLTAEELERAAELAPAAIADTRRAFGGQHAEGVIALGEELHRAGYRTAGRKVIREDARHEQAR